jgi:hypothetical protein
LYCFPSGQLKKQFEGGVVLSLASTSQEGMRQVLQFFDSAHAANCFNRVAEGLTHQINANIKLKVTVDSKEIRDV